jgi:hypothetical protein
MPTFVPLYAIPVGTGAQGVTLSGTPVTPDHGTVWAV